MCGAGFIALPSLLLLVFLESSDWHGVRQVAVGWVLVGKMCCKKDPEEGCFDQL